MGVTETAENLRLPGLDDKHNGPTSFTFAWVMVALFIVVNLAAIGYCAWRKKSISQSAKQNSKSIFNVFPRSHEENRPLLVLQHNHAVH